MLYELKNNLTTDNIIRISIHTHEHSLKLSINIQTSNRATPFIWRASMVAARWQKFLHIFLFLFLFACLTFCTYFWSHSIFFSFRQHFVTRTLNFFAVFCVLFSENVKKLRILSSVFSALAFRFQVVCKQKRE